MDGFWEYVAGQGLETNPYRAGFLQLVVVSGTDARAEEEYYPHIRYFYDKSLHVPPEFFTAPGYMDYRSLENMYKKGHFKSQSEMLKKVGSPSSVRDQLTEAIEKLRVGNLMVTCPPKTGPVINS